MFPQSRLPPPPGRRWRRRLQDWWLQRLGRTDHCPLTHHNVYILPTRAGGVLGVTLLVLLVASINYQLSLGYLLTFLLAGTGLAAMHTTHRNLRGLVLHMPTPTPVHAGSQAAIGLRLQNPSAWDRYAVTLTWQGEGNSTSTTAAWTDAEAGEHKTVALGWSPTQRGRQHLPAVRVETHYPLGVFRAWGWWQPAAQALVYPAPETPCPPWPDGDSPVAEGLAQTPRSGAAPGWSGLRPYRPGDPLKHIAWKQVAKRDLQPPEGWVSKEPEQPSGGWLWLDVHGTGLSGREAQASRLCAWVMAAESQGLDYGLRLPHLQIDPDQGPTHQHRCLEALALW